MQKNTKLKDQGTERTQENIAPLQEKLIEDPGISARKYSLDISKSTFNRITNRDLKCHLYKLHVRKERNNYNDVLNLEIKI